jgi:DNA-3-methyladenine glycosylase
MKKLDRSFYLRDTVTVARDLLGKELVHEAGGLRTAGVIVETEAYTGPEDKGSHSYGGRRTSRNETMYHQGGTSYVYLIYGMYHCFNVVTGPEGTGEAVLIRAIEPICGIEQMEFNRGTDKLINLTSGPGKLCIAFRLDRRHNGLDLTSSELIIADDGWNEPFEVISTTRIGIRMGVDLPWRFYIAGNPFVSKK